MLMKAGSESADLLKLQAFAAYRAAIVRLASFGYFKLCLIVNLVVDVVCITSTAFAAVVFIVFVFVWKGAKQQSRITRNAEKRSIGKVCVREDQFSRTVTPTRKQHVGEDDDDDDNDDGETGS